MFGDIAKCDYARIRKRQTKESEVHPMDDTAGRGTPEIADAPPRPKGRPGRKPKGSVPVVIPETPDTSDSTF